MAAKLLVIAPWPTSYDGTLDTVFNDAIGAEPGTVVVNYLHGRRQEGDITDEVITATQGRIATLIKDYSPEAVLVCGKPTYAAYFGKTDFLKNQGKLIKTDFLPPAVVTYSVAQLKASPKLLEAFAKDAYRAFTAAISPEHDLRDNLVFCDDMVKVNELFDYVVQTGECCFDYETNGLPWWDPELRITLLSISFQHGSAYAIPLHHFESPFKPAEADYALREFRDRILQNTGIRKTAHNLTFEEHVSRAVFGANIVGYRDDTMLMHHLLDETKSHKLKSIVEEYYPEFAGYDEELGTKDWAKIPMDKLWVYGALDAMLTLMLRTQLEAELLQDERSYMIYRNLSMYAQPSLCRMEANGFLVDRERLEANVDNTQVLIDKKYEQLKDFRQVKRWHKAELERMKEELIAETKEKIKACKPLKSGGMGKREKDLKHKLNHLKAGVIRPELEINFGSVKQLGSMLYSDDGFRYPMPTDHGVPKPKTDADTLKSFDDDTGFLKELMRYRSLGKIQSTYLAGILKKLGNDNYVHTSFLIHGTKSGRLSSKEPNLQNIPDPNRVKDDETKQVVALVKDVFICPDGYQLMQFDYSQAELRLMAEFSGDETMIKAYQDGEDIHALTASAILGKSLEEFKELDKDEVKKWRYYAKAVNFGFLYKMAAEGFKDYASSNYDLELSDKEAEEFRQKFFDLYSEVSSYHDEYEAKAREHGHVRTLFGRRRRTPEINAPVPKIRAADERIAVNSPIQGSAGEFTILAVAILDRVLPEGVRLVNTVHDSIFMYIPDDPELIAEVSKTVKNVCENLPMMEYFGRGLEHVTMEVEGEISDRSWNDLKEYEIPGE